MALTFAEADAVTSDYFLADNKKAIDIYFTESFLMDRWMNKRKGLWERPSGGRYITQPLMYDGAEGGFYIRGQSLNSDDRTNVNRARFGWKHVFGNATIYRTDTLENAGAEAEVSLLATRLLAAQKTPTKLIAQNLYNSAVDTAPEITGLGSLTQATVTSTKYGDIAQTELVAADGSYPWTANHTTTTEGISLAVIRTARSTAKISDGPMGKPTVGVMTETLFNIISAALQTQQRFTEDKDTAKAGFVNVVFEGCVLAPDDYVASGNMFLLNENYVGFAVHSDGFFKATPWGPLPNGNPEDKTMKIFWDGNLICSHRKAHVRHSNLS